MTSYCQYAQKKPARIGLAFGLLFLVNQVAEADLGGQAFAGLQVRGAVSWAAASTLRTKVNPS